MVFVHLFQESALSFQGCESFWQIFILFCLQSRHLFQHKIQFCPAPWNCLSTKDWPWRHLTLHWQSLICEVLNPVMSKYLVLFLASDIFVRTTWTFIYATLSPIKRWNGYELKYAKEEIWEIFLLQYSIVDQCEEVTRSGYRNWGSNSRTTSSLLIYNKYEQKGTSGDRCQFT